MRRFNELMTELDDELSSETKVVLAKVLDQYQVSHEEMLLAATDLGEFSEGSMQAGELARLLGRGLASMVSKGSNLEGDPAPAGYGSSFDSEESDWRSDTESPNTRVPSS